jgi:hypothetical protein
MLVNERYPKLKKIVFMFNRELEICTSRESYLVTSLIARTFGLAAVEAKNQ